MKKQLPQKCLPFIIISICFLYLVSCKKEPGRITSEKIIYTDVIPDTVVVTIGTTPVYNLDLDKDGVYDFTFTCTYGRTQCRSTGTSGFRGSVEVGPADNSFNEIQNVVYAASLDTVPVALDSLSEIGSASGEWSFASSQLLRYKSFCNSIGGWPSEYHESGDWPDNIDKYLGLKLVKGTQVFYGWVRLNVNISVGAMLILKDYACNSSSNESIHAGQTE